MPCNPALAQTARSHNNEQEQTNKYSRITSLGVSTAFVCCMQCELVRILQKKHSEVSESAIAVGCRSYTMMGIFNSLGLF